MSITKMKVTTNSGRTKEIEVEDIGNIIKDIETGVNKHTVSGVKCQTYPSIDKEIDTTNVTVHHTKKGEKNGSTIRFTLESTDKNYIENINKLTGCQAKLEVQKKHKEVRNLIIIMATAAAVIIGGYKTGKISTTTQNPNEINSNSIYQVSTDATISPQQSYEMMENGMYPVEYKEQLEEAKAVLEEQEYYQNQAWADLANENKTR